MTRRSTIPADYAKIIRALRARVLLTQAELAGRLGVSTVTVNRWENEQSTPSPLSWKRLIQIDEQPLEPVTQAAHPSTKARLDFTGSPEAVRTVAEGERLSFGHLYNPAFATEISKIDPLPHQRIAVYEHMLRQLPLRFLLADDAGAGKTIMSGLYIREMLARRLIRRVLVVSPAGLIGNWQQELLRLFNLSFRIVTGADAREGNPFAESDQVIVSVDTLAGPRTFARLAEAAVSPFDLVIFDEAHKLSADRGNDLRVRKTGRYRLAEALAGVTGRGDELSLSWSAQHLLLLTATPHQGKEYPYYALWRLLEPSVLSTPEAFEAYSPEHRKAHFLRRTKEEMVTIDGRPLYPKRVSDTLGYDLTQGETSEQALYDATTEYMRYVYNQAKILNRSAARLAMAVIQRRMASCTYALLRSLQRRIEKLDDLIRQIRDGSLTEEQLNLAQRRLGEEEDVFDTKTADEEAHRNGREECELAEEQLLAGVAAASLVDLHLERETVVSLRKLAQRVYDKQEGESKFDRLREVLDDPRFAGEKLIVFTEHKDTLDYLVQRLSGMGFTGQIAQIHGGKNYLERQIEVDRFRQHHADGGARFMICTDAAAEGINLQFCWIMINFDVPWNPARLEQRMGRIHRYGQKHDPVHILNLVAPKTREGRVLEVLLEKIEIIGVRLGHAKVFDSIGRLFEGVSLKQYMEQALTDGVDGIVRAIEGRLTESQVVALEQRDRVLYGTGGDVAAELPRVRRDLKVEAHCRLLPGFVRHYIEHAAPLVDMGLDGDLNEDFEFVSTKRGAMDPLLDAMESYGASHGAGLRLERPDVASQAVWIHPGEPVFEAFRALVGTRLENEAKRGALFVDPTAVRPYLFHLARVMVVRHADPSVPALSADEVLECRLIGVRQYEGAELELSPVEHLLLLRPGIGLPASAQRMANRAESLIEGAEAFIVETTRAMAIEHAKKMFASMGDREWQVSRGFDFQEAELAAARMRLAEKVAAGSPAAAKSLVEIKGQQRALAVRRQQTVASIRREPELVSPGAFEFIAHALVVPSTSPEDVERHDADVERVAMQFVEAFEMAEGWQVRDVHLPELSRAAGLGDNPGFDLLSEGPNGLRRSIEVKGRATSGDVEVTANEWARAANERDRYWLYVVYDCATPSPRLVRVQDPFSRLLARSKGSVLVGAAELLSAAADATSRTRATNHV